MKHLKLLFIVITILILNSCNLVDKAKNEYEQIKNKYDEVVDKDTRGTRPFDITYQKNENAKTAIISSACSKNQPVKYIYFSNQDEAAQHIFSAIKNLYSYPNSNIQKPFWDIRYVNPVTYYLNNNDGSYLPNHASFTGLDSRTGKDNSIIGTGVSQVDASGSISQSKCVKNKLAFGTTLNLYDAPEQAITYAGIASTLTYQIHTNNHIKPWKSNKKGNLLLQSYFDMPIYHNFSQNIGGSVAFNVYLYNPKIKKHLNYVIGLYAFGEAWQKEKAGIRFDPTTNIIHIATVAKKTSWWCAISPKSESIKEIKNNSNKTTKDDEKWNDFYRINITYQNLLAVLKELKTNPPVEVAGEDFGLNPADWEVTLTAVQYELEEEGGKASVSGSFRGFETYISEDAL